MFLLLNPVIKAYNPGWEMKKARNLAIPSLC